MVYKCYILPIGGLYATYHLLGQPETTIDTLCGRWDGGIGSLCLVKGALHPSLISIILEKSLRGMWELSLRYEILGILIILDDSHLDDSHHQSKYSSLLYYFNLKSILFLNLQHEVHSTWSCVGHLIRKMGPSRFARTNLYPGWHHPKLPRKHRKELLNLRLPG